MAKDALSGGVWVTVESGRAAAASGTEYWSAQGEPMVPGIPLFQGQCKSSPQWAGAHLEPLPWRGRSGKI